MNKYYGSLPVDLGKIELQPSEVFYYLYLPISMPSNGANWYLEPRLTFIKPILNTIYEDEPERFKNEFIYVTAKRMYVSPQVTANRPGWHSDGFMSDDLNYVWYDCLPTIFNDSKFIVTSDHIKSLEEFEAQALPENDRIYPDMHLLKLNDGVVHRVQLATRQMMRTFIKISISKNKYNLKDNSHNYNLEYYWKMYDRSEIRNDPATAGLDFKPEEYK
jgi:hypothetical protein